MTARDSVSAAAPFAIGSLTYESEVFRNCKAFPTTLMLEKAIALAAIGSRAML